MMDLKLLYGLHQLFTRARMEHCGGLCILKQAERTFVPHQTDKSLLFTPFFFPEMDKHQAGLIKALPVTTSALPLRALPSSGDFGHLRIQASDSPFTSQSSQTCSEPD